MRTNIDLSIRGTNVRLGDRARDPITGFVGIVTAHVRHLTGCDSVWLTEEAVPEKSEGRSVNVRERYVDVPLLELVQSNPLNATPLPKEVPPAG